MSMIEIKLTFSTIAEAAAFLANNPVAAVEAAKPAATVKAEAPPEAQAETPAAVTYPELQQAVMKVVALGDKGKAALTEIAASFGLATFKGSDASVWGPAKAKIEAVHAKLAGA